MRTVRHVEYKEATRAGDDGTRCTRGWSLNQNLSFKHSDWINILIITATQIAKLSKMRFSLHLC